jgi:hypothetical protein
MGISQSSFTVIGNYQETTKVNEDSEFSFFEDFSERVTNQFILVSTNVSHGRTLNLGNYEFARVTVGVTVFHSDSHLESGEKFSDWADQVALELLGREVSAIEEKPRKPKEIPPTPYGVVKVILHLDGGLTLNLQKHGTAKIDISLSALVAGSIEKSWEPLEKRVSDSIQAKVTKIRNSRGDYVY